MNLIDLQKEMDSVEGFLSQNGKNLREGEVLYHLARKCPHKGVIVEIGSWKGKSTIWMGKGCQAANNNCTIYAVDPHTGSPEHQGEKKVWTYDQFKKNIKQFNLEQSVVPLLKTSIEAAVEFQKPIDLLFIDGAHEYEAVKEDFEIWFPKLKEGGIIAFHDSFRGWEGVNQLMRERIYPSPYLKNICYINSITFGEKAKQISFAEYLKNKRNHFIKTTHSVSYRFPQPLKSWTKRFLWNPYFKKWFLKVSS